MFQNALIKYDFGQPDWSNSYSFFIFRQPRYGDDQ